jgi:hypothetical protein
VDDRFEQVIYGWVFPIDSIQGSFSGNFTYIYPVNNPTLTLMKNLFDTSTKEEITKRINSLTPATQPKWGKMSVAQMLKHATLPMGVALTNPKPKRTLMAKIFGPMIKGPVIGPKPFKKNGFTPKEFRVDSQEVFDEQKSALLTMLGRFTPANVSDKNHPFFGLMTDAEWGESQYKHLDHHLTQFGA